MTDFSNTCSTNTFFVSELWCPWWPVLLDCCTITQGNWRFVQVPFICNEGNFICKEGNFVCNEGNFVCNARNFNDVLIVRLLPSVCQFAWKWRYITMCSCLELVLRKTSWRSMLHARYVNSNVNIIRSKAWVVKAAVGKMFRRNIAWFLIKNFTVSCLGTGWIQFYGMGSPGIVWSFTCKFIVLIVVMYKF